MRIRALNHSTYQHQYHLVWGTKYRRKFLKEYVRVELLKIIYAWMKKYPTLYLHAVNTDQDHIHLQLEIPPNLSVSEVIQAMKIHTSKSLRKKFKFINQMYLTKEGIWSVGYFSSTIGLNEDQILKYIKYQSKKDLPQQPKLEFS